ncbi:MAG TPA: tetratricopeptide repeat protein [bacterium]|nr:tetratricopeptide repeat protein [bacterium]
MFHRHLNQTWLDSAQAIVSTIRRHEPANEAGLCLWARICLLTGDGGTDRKEKQNWYVKARATADTLRQRNPENPDGHMWWATAQGRLGQLRGILSSAGMSGSLKSEYEQVLRLDSGYALAWYAMGRLYEALPSLLGGNLKRAEDYLRHGLVADSNYTTIRLELARVYLRLQKPAEARRELELLLNTSQPTDPAEFALDDRPAALALLDSIQPKQKQSSRL